MILLLVKRKKYHVYPQRALLSGHYVTERESDGTNDVMNIKKMEDIKKHFLQEYASNENINCETNDSTQSGKPRRPDNQFGSKIKIKEEKNLKKTHLLKVIIKLLYLIK